MKPPLPPSPMKSHAKGNSPSGCEGRGEDREPCSSSSDTDDASSHSSISGNNTNKVKNGMVRASSNLDLTGAFISEVEIQPEDGEIQGDEADGDEENTNLAAPSIGLPQQTAKDVSHFAIGKPTYMRSIL